MSAEGANLRSIDAVTRFKASLVKCLAELNSAVAEATSEVERTQVWLEHEMPLYWKSEHRKRAEWVVSCKSALFRKQMVTSAKDSKPSIVDEKKALARAIVALEESEQKLKAIDRWRVGYQRELILYKGAMSPMSNALDRDLPMAVATLNRMAIALEQYLAAAPPDLGVLLESAQSAAAADVAEAESTPSMRRTGGPDQPGPAEPEPTAP